MKKLAKAIALVAVFAVALSPLAFAASTSTAPVNVSMNVQSSLTINATIVNMNGGATVTSMNFGNLGDADANGNLDSPNWFTVYLTANSQTIPYIISQTGTAMSNGTTTIPSAALKVTPVYAAGDNGGLAMPTGAALGTAGSWVATDKTLYDSENSNAAIRTIQAIYAIQNGVPVNQAAGNYAGTVTFTVTTT